MSDLDANPYEPVRAKDPASGHEFTTSAIHAKTAGLTVLDKPAVDMHGRHLPAKPNTDKSGKPAPATPKESV